LDFCLRNIGKGDQALGNEEIPFLVFLVHTATLMLNITIISASVYKYVFIGWFVKHLYLKLLM